MADILNADLYERLQTIWGVGNVEIRSRGQKMVASYRTDIAARRMRNGQEEGRRVRLVAAEPGQEFLVACRFCHDWKNRLSINYRWAQYDERTGTRNLWMAHCYNEECLTEFERQRQLFDMVYHTPMIGGAADAPVVVRQSGRRMVQKTRGWPGAMLSLEQLYTQRQFAGHRALRFLYSRHYRPEYLWKRYRLHYCVEADNPREASERIIAPVFVSGRMVGWQGRTLDKKPPKGVAKWYTCPGMRKRFVLYNFDMARKHHTIVLEEGPADVWNFGPQGTAVFGKKLSQFHLELLKRHCPGATIVVLFDPKPDEKQREHHIVVAERMLLDGGFERDQVVPCYLPEPYDPGELDREYMWDYLHMTASRQGVKLNLGRK